MDRNNYPALRDRPDFVYLDASNGFPLHERIIQRTTMLASTYIGMPLKGEYRDALAINDIVGQARQKVANLIGADVSEIHFVSSASEAVKLIVESWCINDTKVAYSPEDHIATMKALAVIPDDRKEPLTYGENGTLQAPSTQPNVFFLNYLHQLYGTGLNLADIRTANPSARLVLDASQAVARHPINVHSSEVDALYFSGHKLGAIPGAGVLYIAKKYQNSVTLPHASLPWITIASIETAIDILTEQSMINRDLYLAKLTTYAVEQLQDLPNIEFSKGLIHDLEICSGNGIVSFRIPGLSSYDVMLLLDDHGIAVRGGDHCVSPKFTSQDYVRISMQAYSTQADIDRLVAVLKTAI